MATVDKSRSLGKTLLSKLLLELITNLQTTPFVLSWFRLDEPRQDKRKSTIILFHLWNSNQFGTNEVWHVDRSLILPHYHNAAKKVKASSCKRWTRRPEYKKETNVIRPSLKWKCGEFFSKCGASLPPPPHPTPSRKKAENMWKTIPFSFRNHISPQDLLGSSISRNCLQHKPKYLFWKHKLHSIIKPSKVPSNENNVIHIYIYFLKHKKREGSLWSLHKNLL
jgi:hypothetical protein